MLGGRWHYWRLEEPDRVTRGGSRQWLLMGAGTGQGWAFQKEGLLLPEILPKGELERERYPGFSQTASHPPRVPPTGCIYPDARCRGFWEMQSPAKPENDWRAVRGWWASHLAAGRASPADLCVQRSGRLHHEPFGLWLYFACWFPPEGCELRYSRDLISACIPGPSMVSDR